METEVVVMVVVQDFIDSLEFSVQKEVYKLIFLLRNHGHTLSMPEAKPVGRGLWELRVNAKPAIRILYGFCDRRAILVLGFKKQRSAIFTRDFNLALKRFKAYCN